MSGGGTPAEHDVDSPAPAAEGGAPRGRRPVVIALMLAMALAAVEGTIVSTAVPQIVADLGGFSYFSWLFSGYFLALTVTIPVYGKLSDTFGRKPVLLAGIGVFLLGSALCAGAWDMASLIAFRILQGLGGGAIQGTVQTVAGDLYPPAERPRIQAALSSVWAVSAVAGPAVGGLLAGYADWRWIFLVNVPVGGLALWLLARRFTETRRLTETGRFTETGRTGSDRSPGAGVRGVGVRGAGVRGARIDWAGALAVFGSGGLLLTWLVQGGVAWPWGSAPSLGLLAATLAAVAVTVAVERRAANPVIPGWVWRRRTIAPVNVAMAALGLLMVAPTVFLPTYAQYVLGLGPVQAGFVLTVMTLSWPVSAALSQHVYRRTGYRQSAALGMALTCLVLLAFPLFPPAGPWHAAALSLALGGALGLFQLPLLVAVQSSVPWRERGTATASVLFNRQLGQSVGATLLAAVANLTFAGRPATSLGAADLTAATGHVYATAAGAAALAVLALCFAPRRFPGEETAPRRPNRAD